MRGSYEMRDGDIDYDLENDLSRRSVERVEAVSRNVGNLQRTVISGRLVSD